LAEIYEKLSPERKVLVLPMHSHLIEQLRAWEEEFYEKNDAFVCVGRHGGLVLIDTKKKITIVYAQYVKDMPLEQFEMYPNLRKLVYECIGADTWSMGYNVLP